MEQLAAVVVEKGGWLRAGALIHVEAPIDVAYTAPPDWRVHSESHAGAVRYVLYRRTAIDPLS